MPKYATPKIKPYCGGFIITSDEWHIVGITEDGVLYRPSFVGSNAGLTLDQDGRVTLDDESIPDEGDSDVQAEAGEKDDFDRLDNLWAKFEEEWVAQEAGTRSGLLIVGGQLLATQIELNGTGAIDINE